MKDTSTIPWNPDDSFTPEASGDLTACALENLFMLGITELSEIL
ncbi:MAG: hypothetical protein ACLSEX_02210 [Blautia sp.]